MSRIDMWRTDIFKILERMVMSLDFRIMPVLAGFHSLPTFELIDPSVFTSIDLASPTLDYKLGNQAQLTAMRMQPPNNT